ncbi:MAG: hypothetical protein WC006_00825 [Bacilli bacterium]
MSGSREETPKSELFDKFQLKDLAFSPKDLFKKFYVGKTDFDELTKKYNFDVETNYTTKQQFIESALSSVNRLLAHARMTTNFDNSITTINAKKFINNADILMEHKYDLSDFSDTEFSKISQNFKKEFDTNSIFAFVNIDENNRKISVIESHKTLYKPTENELKSKTDAKDIMSSIGYRGKGSLTSGLNANVESFKAYNFNMNTELRLLTKIIRQTIQLDENSFQPVYKYGEWDRNFYESDVFGKPNTKQELYLIALNQDSNNISKEMTSQRRESISPAKINDVVKNRIETPAKTKQDAPQLQIYEDFSLDFLEQSPKVNITVSDDKITSIRIYGSNTIDIDLDYLYYSNIDETQPFKEYQLKREFIDEYSDKIFEKIKLLTDDVDFGEEFEKAIEDKKSSSDQEKNKEIAKLENIDDIEYLKKVIEDKKNKKQLAWLDRGKQELEEAYLNAPKYEKEFFDLLAKTNSFKSSMELLNQRYLKNPYIEGIIMTAISNKIEDISSNEEILNRYDKKVNYLDNVIKEKDNEIAKLEIEKTNLVLDIEHIKDNHAKDLEEFKERLDLVIQESNIKIDELKDLSEYTIKLEETFEELTNTYVKTVDKLDNANITITRLDNTAKEKDAYIYQLQQDATNNFNDFMSQIKSLNETIIKLQDKNINLEQTNQQFKNKVDEIEPQNKKLTDEIEKLKGLNQISNTLKKM